VGSGYVYDGVNLVQELNAVGVDNSSASSIRANYLGGLGIDEVYAQQTGSGTTAQAMHFLSDALGSTIRLTNQTGTKLVDYTYDVYGNTTADAVVNNPIQYTGRENDGDGLYYYRARYYSPQLMWFISSDPIGLAGGINTYSYVKGNPLSYIDPLGLFGYSYGTSVATTAIVGWGITGGMNGQFFSDGPSTTYGVKGTGWGLDISADAQANGALYFGKGCADAKSWEGDFTAINIGAFGFAGSFFWGGGWFGASFGAGTGPAALKFGATVTNTTYVPLH
jgi:RHS repeat-associated protein